MIEISHEVAAAMSFWREPPPRGASSEPVVADFQPALVDPRISLMTFFVGSAPNSCS
jgi:hypothetical protein